MVDVVNYIRSKILETTPDADIRPGSAIDDLLVNPLYSIMSPYINEHENLINFLTLRDPESISESEMDHLASNFFITRLNGSKVTGNVRLYYDRPVSVDIPRNAKFISSGGKVFYAKNTYSINKIDMAANIEGSLYYAGDILVESEDSGSDYEISANSVISVDSASVVPVRVRNPRAFTGSTKKETNTELAERIKNTFLASSLLSSYSIENALKTNYSNIRAVNVVGAGSPYMKRDVVSVGSEFISSYLGKQKGLTLYPDIASIAYFKVHNAFTPVNSGVNLPAVGDFEREFITYRGIWRNDNNYYETLDQKEFETETFNGQYWLVSGLGSDSYVNPGWVISDPAYGTAKYNPFAITLVPDQSAVRLGINSNDIPAKTTMDVRLIGDIQQLVTKVRDGYNDIFDAAYIAQLLKQIQDSTNPEVVYNYYPVFHRYISLNAGIVITGRFKTDSTAADNTMSYITVHRTNGAISPHDGFGIAWKVGDGSTYNVYVVDNNVLQDDVWVGKSMIVQDYGINNFLQAYKIEITSNTWYEFRIEITDDYGINAWIASESSGGVDKTDPADIQFGEVFNYKPLASSQGSHFGVSVGGTKNKEWFYSNLGITTLDDNYPIHMFKMYLDSNYFKNGDLITLNYYGVGEGINASGTVENNSLRLFLYNHNETAWESIAGHDNDASGDIQAYVVSGIAPTFIYNTDYVNSDYIYVLATADTTASVSHKIKTYYIEAVNGDGVHTGNFTDIYVDSPDRILETSYTGTVSNGVISFQGVGPIQEIRTVAVESGPVLEDDEWSVQYVTQGEAFASGATIKIIPTVYNESSTSLVITYRYLSDGDSMQSFVESDNFRAPSQNNLIKVMPAYTVEITNFNYNGNVTTSELKTKIKEYINSLTSKTLTISSLISIALNNGVDSVDTSDISINIRYTDLNGRQFVQAMVNSYTINGMGYFFTTLSDLSGISQL